MTSMTSAPLASIIPVHDHTRCVPGEPCYAGRPAAEVPACKLICLRLVEPSNGIKVKPTERCTNERLPGSSLCAHHLGEAAADYRRIVQDATGEEP